MRKPTLATAILLVAATGCLLDDTHHTLLLDHDGALTWVARQEDIRSDRATEAEREKEEGRFLEEVRRQTHPVARALRALGAVTVECDLRRAERPYAVETRARFESAAGLAESLLTALGIPARADLRHSGSLATLVVTVRAPRPGAEDDAATEGEDIVALVEEPTRYSLALTDGRFVEARGFWLRADGQSAGLKAISEKDLERAGGEVNLQLTWMLGRASNPGGANVDKD